MAKLHWISAIIGLCIGGLVVGATWEVTHIVTRSGPIVATVGATTIHRPAFEQQLDQRSGSQTLTTMIESQLINDAAKKAGVSATTAQITQLKTSVEAQNGITSDAQLQTALAANGVTMAQFTDQLRVQALAQNLAESKVKVTDAQIKTYYDGNKPSFKKKPLSAVRTQITQTLKQQNAESPQQLLSELAKTDKIIIHDPTFASVKTQIENPTATGLGQ